MGKADDLQDNCTAGGLETLTGALNHLSLKEPGHKLSVEQESSRSSDAELSSDNEAQECLKFLELTDEKQEDTDEKIKNKNKLTKSDHDDSKPIITVTDSDVQNGNDLCKTSLSSCQLEESDEENENDSDKKEKNDESYESDEDNENAILTSASQDGTSPEEPEEPQEDAKDNLLTRGPCKGSRSHYVAHRYNPLDEVLYDPPAPSPYQQHHHHMQQQMSPIPETLQYGMSPAYSTMSGYSPEYTSPAGNYGGCSDYSPAPFDLGYLSPEYGGNSNSSPPAGLAFDAGEESLLSPNYLAALEDAVARTVSASSNPSSEDESDGSNSCVRFIMDSLRCIDKAELDYIAPPSPGPQTDLEQDLALSVEPLDDYALNPSPPLSPFSPSLPATPLSPDFFALDSGPPVFTQELKELCRSAVATVREMCHAEVIMHAAKRVANQRTADLCNKDPDGDTCFLIVVCKPSDSPKFYENVFVLQQHLQKLRMCCDVPLEAGNKCCPLCGGGPSAWRSPLSETNNAGDSAVSCAVKMHHPAEVVHYLCAGVLLSGCAEDWRRVFGGQGRALLAPYVGLYPLLSRFL